MSADYIEEYDYEEMFGPEPERTPEELKRIEKINKELGITDADTF